MIPDSLQAVGHITVSDANTKVGDTISVVLTNLTSHSSAFWTPFIPVLAALVTASIIAGVSYFVARKQIRAQINISERSLAAQVANIQNQIEAQREINRQLINANLILANRQKWIEHFRENIAEFASLAKNVFLLLQNNRWRKEVPVPEKQKLLDDEGKLDLVSRKVELLLNPENEDDAVIIQIMDVVHSSIKERKLDDGIEFGLQTLFENARVVIDRESDKIRVEDKPAGKG
jgi:hypothetical protein